MEISKLRVFREQRGWSQKRLADLIDTSKENISRWECGKQKPGSYYQEKLCSLFDVSASELGFISIKGTEYRAPQSSYGHIEILTHMQEVLPQITAAISDSIIGAISGIEGAYDMDKQRRNISKAIGAAILTPLFTVELHDHLNKRRDFASTFPEEFLSQCQQSIKLCWDMYFSGGSTIVEPYLQTCLPQLANAAQQPTKSQHLAAALTAQAYQLYWILALQRQDFGVALTAIKQAYEYGKIAGDPNLCLSALVRQIHTYHHLKNPIQQLFLHDLALQYAAASTPLIRGWLYFVLAASCAQLNREDDTYQYLDLAHNTFPVIPEHDPNFSYAPVSHFTFANHEILAYLQLKKAHDALNIVERVDKTTPMGIVPRRVELTNRQLATFCVLGDLDKTCDMFESAVKTAQQSGSLLRYTEVCDIYVDMLQKWPDEKKVRNLASVMRKTSC